MGCSVITDAQWTAHEVECHQQFYRWWTLKIGRWYLKLGPVTMVGYRWFDGRGHVDICVLGHQPILSTNPAMRSRADYGFWRR